MSSHILNRMENNNHHHNHSNHTKATDTDDGDSWKMNIIHTSHRASSMESFKVMDVLQRANQLQAEGYNVFHCEVGQPESGAPKTVTQAAMDALKSPPPKSILGYTDAFGLVSLRQAIATHYQQKYHVTIDTNRIVITTGSSGAFLLAFTAAFDVHDVVAIASCGYPCYRNILGTLGCSLVNIPINSQFKLTAHELLAVIQQRKTDHLTTNIHPVQLYTSISHTFILMIFRLPTASVHC